MRAMRSRPAHDADVAHGPGTTLTRRALHVFDAAERAAEEYPYGQHRLRSMVACLRATPGDVTAALLRCRALRQADPVDSYHADAVVLLEELLSTMPATRDVT